MDMNLIGTAIAVEHYPQTTITPSLPIPFDPSDPHAGGSGEYLSECRAGSILPDDAISLHPSVADANGRYRQIVAGRETEVVAGMIFFDIYSAIERTDGMPVAIMAAIKSIAARYGCADIVWVAEGGGEAGIAGGDSKGHIAP